MSNLISEESFSQLAAQGYNRIPLIVETFADLDTPLSLYLKLANKPYSYLLESVQGGERFGRYSFIGLPANTRIVVHDKSITLTTPTEEVTKIVDNPLDFIKDYQSHFKVAPLSSLPRFVGGLAGYFGYDTVRYIEPRLAKTKKQDTLGTPDILLMLTEQLAVIDNLSGKLTLIVYANPELKNAYALAHKRLQELVYLLRQPVKIPEAPHFPPQQATSEFGEEAYKQAVEKAKHYIFDGDVMQVVPSQRMSQPFPASPLNLYRVLRSINPSPYMFYYDMGDHHVVGASPEILVRLEGKNVTVRPIAGTRPRGKTSQQDIELEQELLSDPKELAEHLMLIDLGRNDVGRVAQQGTVKLTEKMVIERYSHVMHLVSNVEGVLKPELDAIEVLKATFPAGTVSGASKVRAMEIIDELEPSKRGIYAGAVGYLSFNGDMDLAIAIRTAVIKEGVLYVQSGGGLVADSVPASEWTETQNKARAILRAAEIVLSGLDSNLK